MNAPYTPADVPTVPYADYATFGTTAIGLFGAVDSHAPPSAVRTISIERFDVRAEFARLVAMGDRVVPLLIEELKLGRYVWLELLTTIVGEQGPVLSESQASSRASVAEAWIEWEQTKQS